MGCLKVLLCLALFVYAIQALPETEKTKLEDAVEKENALEDPTADETADPSRRKGRRICVKRKTQKYTVSFCRCVRYYYRRRYYHKYVCKRRSRKQRRCVLFKFYGYKRPKGYRDESEDSEDEINENEDELEESNDEVAENNEDETTLEDPSLKKVPKFRCFGYRYLWWNVRRCYYLRVYYKNRYQFKFVCKNHKIRQRVCNKYYVGRRCPRKRGDEAEE